MKENTKGEINLYRISSILLIIAAIINFSTGDIAMGSSNIALSTLMLGLSVQRKGK